MYLTQKELNQLLKYQGEEGAVTIYFYSNPKESDREVDMRLNSLFTEVKKEIEKKGFTKALTNQLPRAKESILSDFALNKAQTFAIFLSPDSMTGIKLPIKLKDRFMVDKNFFIPPLFAVLEQFNRYAILIFNRREARLFTYFLGEMTEEEKIFHNYVIPNINSTSGSWEGTHEKKIAHRIENTFHRHLKEVSAQLFSHFKAEDFDKLILASHEDELQAIKGHLHSYLQDKLAGEFTANPNQDTDELYSKMKKAVRKYRTRMEEAKINKLIDDISSTAVVGARKVIDALNQDRIRELVLNPDLNLSGFSCPEKHYFAIEKPDENKCPYCDKKLIQEDYLENDLIDHTFLHGAEIFHILENKSKFKNQNIGAFLRY